MGQTHPNTDINDLSPHQDFKRIISPSIGFPNIQFPGSTFNIKVSAEPGLPTDIYNWAAQICKGPRRIALEDETTIDMGTNYHWASPLQTLEVAYYDDFLYQITVKIPSKANIGLYDLKLTIGRESFTQENSIQILRKFPSQPTFCVLSDLHIGFKGYPCIDEPNIDEISLAIDSINEINNIHPDFIIIAGDLVDWSSKSNWNDFTNIIKLLEVPSFTIVGNHDYYWDNWWIGYPPMLPAPTRSDPVSLRYYLKYINPHLRYSFNYGPLHITCLNSGDDAILTPVEAFGSGLSDDDINWLKNDLNSNDKNFIFMHHPVTRAGSNDDFTTKNCTGCITQNREEFMNICSQNNVIAVFSGHEHKFEHWHEGGVDYYTVPSATRSNDDNAIQIVKHKTNRSHKTEILNSQPKHQHIAPFKSPV